MMRPLKTVWWMFQLVLGCLVALLCANLYAHDGAGFGFDIPANLYRAVLAGVFVAPAFWAVAHLVGGVVMGVLGGSFFEALRMALMLGVGMALAQLWMPVLGASLGIWVVGGPLWYSVLGFVAALALFGLDRAMGYFWRDMRETRSG